MKLIGFDREEEAEEWARKKLDLKAAPEFFRALSATDEKSEFVCVVVMTNFTTRNVDLSIVMDTKKVRPKAVVEMFNQVFDFTFKTLKVSRVTGLLRGKNKRSKLAAERFGFKLEGIMRQAFVDDDLHIYGFLAQDYYSHPWYRG